MTLVTEDSVASFACDGNGVRFDLPFVFFTEHELQVVEYDPATDVSMPRALSAHYTVVGGDGALGAVIANIAPPSGKVWRIWRHTARRQETDYQENDAFPAAVHERALDRLQAQIQAFVGTFSRQGDLKEGEVIHMDWVPGTGLVATRGGQPVGTPIDEPAFYNAVLRIWLGDKPADDALKPLLLGKS